MAKSGDDKQDAIDRLQAKVAEHEAGLGRAGEAILRLTIIVEQLTYRIEKVEQHCGR